MNTPSKSARSHELAETEIERDGRWVYVIGPTDGPYKIGIANDVQKRRRLLNTGNHKHLHIYHEFDAKDTPNAKMIERSLHYTFFKQHVRGEWFALSEESLNNFRGTFLSYTVFEHPVPEGWSLTRATCDQGVRAIFRKARLALELTEKDVADLADLSSATVRNFESGKRGPNQETIDSIKNALTAKGAIFSWEGEKLSLTFQKSEAK